MNPSRNCTAIKGLAQGVLLLALWALAALALAAPVAGTVVQLSGPLFAKKANGTVKALAVKSEVENGDTLVTEKNTYAMVKFIDNSEITLKPESSLTIENFSFDKDRQEGDKASFNLLKGGLRSVTGLLGKRNKEKFELKTPSATIGIRGTTFIAQYVPPPPGATSTPLPGVGPASGPGQAAPGPLQVTPAPPAGALAPGLYVQVLDGLITLTNPAGTQQFSAGQFGYTPNFQVPPIVLPQNPGLKFQPPPVFQGAGPGVASNGPPKSNAVDCEVR
jgi:hypothetical protein